jgi:hypothetical protein
MSCPQAFAAAGFSIPSYPAAPSFKFVDGDVHSTSATTKRIQFFANRKLYAPKV